MRSQHLIEAVTEEFDASGGTYGSPKIWIRLVWQGWRVSVNTIARIMAELGLVAWKVCRRWGLTRPGRGRPPRTSCAATSPPRHRTWSGAGT
ncbi:IS3 family transposase [Streptomyces sp. NBC_00996]|uniref:IS3 family transposase n=1 Tax=Streptomyces sp. NBC_00996 TaxID=2903710 RepID=UPI00386C16F8